MRSHVPIFPIGSAVLTGDSKPNGRLRSTPCGRSHLGTLPRFLLKGKF
ncbi:hypothetical protein [Cylindrospermopsis raciborskii]|nr:hypothetical protein [Cylindrospermopsis raciborskii]